MRWMLAAASLTMLPAGVHAADLASDQLYSYNPPPSGSPVYANNPLAGDMTGLIGTDHESDDYDETWYEFQGRVNIPLANSWNFQPDVYYGHYDGDYGNGNYFGAIGHFYKRLPNAAVGVYAGGKGWDSEFHVWAAGVEAETYAHPNAIIGGRVHYADDDWGGGWLQGELWADYFFTPNTKATGELMAWAGMSGDSDGWEGVLSVTHRFAGTPLSATIGGNAGSEDWGHWYEFWGGVTVNFDQRGTTQYQHDLMVPFKEFAL